MHRIAEDGYEAAQDENRKYAHLRGGKPRLGLSGRLDAEVVYEDECQDDEDRDDLDEPIWGILNDPRNFGTKCEYSETAEPNRVETACNRGSDPRRPPAEEARRRREAFLCPDVDATGGGKGGAKLGIGECGYQCHQSVES